MKTKILLTGLGLTVILGGLLVGDWGSRARGAGDRRGDDKEVTKDPAVLISPTLDAAQLSVYGLKLGDSTERMPGDAGLDGRTWTA